MRVVTAAVIATVACVVITVLLIILSAPTWLAAVFSALSYALVFIRLASPRKADS